VRAALRTKRYQDLLARWAKIDGLTGLGNRAHFTERLAEACELASRHDRPLALVMLDVDHFKRLNDTQGHPFGDQVLTRIGEVILANVRSTDVACRYGGEEIAIIAPETTLEEGMSLAERLRAGVAEMGLRSHGEVIHVTASLGVAACGGASRRPCAPPALVERADAALYRAKHQGRDRVCEG
jgi:diguanylate cyclase (GGDEF)-like protein